MKIRHLKFYINGIIDSIKNELDFLYEEIKVINIFINNEKFEIHNSSEINDIIKTLGLDKDDAIVTRRVSLIDNGDKDRSVTVNCEFEVRRV